MKQRQYITAFSLILALTGLSPVVASDRGATSEPQKLHTGPPSLNHSDMYRLTDAHMESVHAGEPLNTSMLIFGNPRPTNGLGTTGLSQGTAIEGAEATLPQ